MAKILLIDDDPAVREYLRLVLTKAGHSVNEASEGKAGIEAVHRDMPDLIITDLFMPGMEGIETIFRMRRVAPGIPIVAMSGGGSWGMIESLNDACSLGAAYSLPKPISGEVLLQVINELLNGAARSVACSNAIQCRVGKSQICPKIRTCGLASSSTSCGATTWAERPVVPTESTLTPAKG